MVGLIWVEGSDVDEGMCRSILGSRLECLLIEIYTFSITVYPILIRMAVNVISRFQVGGSLSRKINIKC